MTIQQFGHQHLKKCCKLLATEAQLQQQADIKSLRFHLESQFWDVILLLEKEMKLIWQSAEAVVLTVTVKNEQTENNYDVTNKLVLQEETFLIADYKYKQGNKLLTRNMLVWLQMLVQNMFK